MKTIILSLAIATSSYTHSTTHQLTNAQVYAQIEAINNAAAQEALSTGYAHQDVPMQKILQSTDTAPVIIPIKEKIVMDSGCSSWNEDYWCINASNQ